MHELRIDRFCSELHQKTHRVSVRVNDIPLWFESDDITLHPSPEGFVAAMLFTALKNNVNLVVDAPLCKKWFSNIKQLMAIYQTWWKLPQISIHCQELINTKIKKVDGTGLCFSGGADSFYTLRFQKDLPINHLIYVHGYDIDLKDNARIKSFQKSLLSICEAVHAKPVIVKTNLREHPLYKGISWPQSHGGALAAAGCMISDIKNLIISASFPYAYSRPWGTHWETDHLWSSDKLTVSHYGAELWKTDKLISLKDDQLVRSHLRVCWEKKNSHINCCQCEKCLRTMLALNQCHALEKFRTFLPESLHDLVNKVDSVHPFLIPVYKRFLQQSRSKQLSEDLKALIARSETSISPHANKNTSRFAWFEIFKRYF